MTDPVTILAAALVGGAVGGAIGGILAAKLSSRNTTKELPAVDPKTIAALVVQEMEIALNDVRGSIGSIGEKLASMEETVSSLYQLFAAYLGAAAAYRPGRRRRAVSQSQSGGQQAAANAGESKSG
ncbi:chromosome segregation protein SMC [Pyrolobus fumarii 1A]|uniref:Chromosome segregation protein SMC n=1 Tax=Pyrolobus fumarii (strain DSM 11204 / 1A) TaxID=694429 RepID=G0EE20_PYRF1|nr:hypothetical protein [Pyrolobus fumarii]AEM37936.1 chromosome segregation protein SMC [Pyrolobus fumarii 1A]